MSELHQLVSRQISRWNKERDTLDRWLANNKSEEGMIRPSDFKPVVTVSRQRGCRGKEFTKLLAHDLKYGMIDHALIDYIAKHVGVRSELVELLDEHDRSELEFWMKEIFSGHAFDQSDYIRELGEAVKSSALHGGVVILGRGANYFLKESQVFRVRLVAPLSTRIENLATLYGMTEKQAEEEVTRVDEERAQFVKRYFRKDINDPSDYELTVNMATNTLDGAVKTVISAMRAKGWTMDATGGDMRANRRIAV